MSLSFSFSKAGITIGLICLATLFLIDVFGPDQYFSSGSGIVMADGTVVTIQSSQPLLPMVARTAFFALLLPLVFGAIAFFRKESVWLALGSCVLGLAPVLIYTLGTFMTSMLYFVMSSPLIAVFAARRGRKE